MFSIELSVNIVMLVIIMLVSGLAGFALRRWNIVKTRARLYRVENELLRSHAEILELQKQCLTAEQKVLGISKPLIAMSSPPPNKNNKKLPNATLRKKLLTNVLRTAHIKAIS